MTDINKYLNRLSNKRVSSIGLKCAVHQVVEDRILSLHPNLLILLSKDYGATDFIRLLGPSVVNDSYEHTATICLDKLTYNKTDNMFNISNTVLSLFKITFLVSREKIESSSFAALKELKQQYPHIRLIVDIDDDLFSIPTNHPEYDHYINRIKILDKLIDLSNVVVVSTAPIEQQIKKRHPNKNIAIIPNYLNDHIWNLQFQPPTHGENEIRVLYAGTETHDADLRLLAEAIPEIAKAIKDRTGKRLRIIVVGGTSLEIEGMEILRVPDDKRSYPDYVAWIQAMPVFDYAIAPLDLKNEMNRSKSYLKFLEYSAMGLPAIFTDIEPYSEVIDDHLNGILIPSNDLNLWKNAMIELASDEDIKQKLAQECVESLNHNLLLSDHQLEWKRVIED